MRERRNRKDRRGKTPEQIRRDYRRHELAYAEAVKGQQRIMLPRLGAHFSSWGSGHTHTGPAHDGPCICTSGITQPYDEEQR